MIPKIKLGNIRLLLRTRRIVSAHIKIAQKFHKSVPKKLLLSKEVLEEVR